uniref:NBS-LRR-like resistance protein n=1 Tax=Oryza sativa TaxID=4530 RepID=A0A0U2JSE5_ORYSA|nr:NBS-LRR-like resistance protein [Oryza sativa]
MEAAVGAANWVVGMVLNKLSDELMAGYMASRELGLNMDQIKRDLSYMLALLQAPEGRDIADNLGLQRLLADLCNKADEAEDVLDELHYFVIRDELDGTREATPDLGDGLGAQLRHARHAARNTAAGNYWLSCFSSCCRSQSQQDDTVTVVTGNNRNTSMAISKTDEEHDQSGASGHIQESLFDRVAMSKKIKSLIQDIVSSRECANINYSSFRADDILPSIRHLSITIQDKYTESFKEEMEKIKKRVDIRNLRSVMIFGSYRSRRIANVVRDTLNEIRALRVLFIFMNSPHSLPDNFSKLVHLRYLKIGSPWGFKVCVPSTVSKLYHLKFLDLKSWGGSNNNLPNDFNRLINLRHFLAKKEFHSNVPEVGKMKCLQELKEFHVKKDKIGFELAQLGQLEQLRGELCIFGLKNATREEAIEAKLKHKSNLSKLRLDRGGNREKNTSSSSSRTQVVSNENQDDDIILDSLQPHSNLTELSIVNLGGGMAPSWLGSNIIHLDTLHLDGLERLECISCPKLNELPLSSCSSSSCTMWFPKLRRLNITRCLELSVPLVPHTSTLTYVRVNDSVRGFNTSKKLTLDGYNGALAFQNLGNLEEIYIGDVHNMSLIDFQQLRSLRRLTVTLCRDTFLRGLDEHVVVVFNSVRVLNLSGFLLTRKMLSNLFRCFPALYVLSMSPSKESHEEVKLQIPSSCSLKTIRLFKCKNLILPPLDDGQGLVNLTSLRNLHIDDYGKIFSQWYMGKPAQTTSNPFPSSLLELSICRESRIHSMALLSNLTALTSLQLIDCCNVTMDGFNPLITSNLNKLCISSCGSAPADLLAEMARTKTTMPQVAFQLKDLVVDSISAVLTAPICSFLAPTLHELGIKDDVDRVSSFSDEQEGALELLVSLKKLSFDGLWVLQSLPEGLHKFPSLTELSISHCPQIQSLPKNGLPTSLETFSVFICSSALEEESKRFTEEKERYYSESDDWIHTFSTMVNPVC